MSTTKQTNDSTESNVSVGDWYLMREDENNVLRYATDNFECSYFYDECSIRTMPFDDTVKVQFRHDGTTSAYVPIENIPDDLLAKL